MTSRLVAPPEAMETLRRRVTQKWADAVCAEAAAPVKFSIPLRPGVSTGTAVIGIGLDTWHKWLTHWRDFTDQHPGLVVHKPVSVQGVTADYPATLIANLDAAATLLSETGPPPVDVDRARTLASSLRSTGALLTPANLRAAYQLGANDTEVLLSAVTWLQQHPDVSAWTARQLPIPGMHTKWLDTHGTLLRDVTGRDVRDEVRPRPAVLHLTYVDPDHAASGHRRHDAWTTGDTHDIEYRPQIVLVVENRDSRLWFPPVPDTIVVEGGGKAAAALLANVPWIRAADHIVYWGDIDADGYAILDGFRAALAKPAPDGTPPKRVGSILMDATDLHRYAQHGVNHDKHGRPLKPSGTALPHLTEPEKTAYDTIATGGPTPFRRIEQEAIPLPDAATRLLKAIASPRR